MVYTHNTKTNTNISSHYYYIPPTPSTKLNRSVGRSMRTIRSNIFTQSSPVTDYSSDISGELYRLANIPHPGSCNSYLHSKPKETEITETVEPEDIQHIVNLCVSGLKTTYISTIRSSAEKLRLLAKDCSKNRALIGNSGAVPALIQLLCCSDSFTQEQAVTALLNLSLLESNRSLITNAGAVKPLIYVLKTGTENSKQNAACALLSLALVDEYRTSIGASGSIPPLVALLKNGSNRGKKDALTTLYKLCSVKLNKERAIRAGAVRVLVGLIGEKETGLAEKAIVVLNSLARIEMGKEKIVEEDGISALLEVVEDGSGKGKGFAVFTLLLLCGESVRNRGVVVRKGGIPALVELSQNGTRKAKHKAETLLGYLREQKPETSSRCS